MVRMGWWSRNWKTIVVAAVSTAAFVAVAAALPLLVVGAPVLLALAAGGLASGAAGYVTRQLPIAQGLRPARQALMAVADNKYRASVEEAADEKLRNGAQENVNHVKRLIAAVDDNEAAIRASGRDPERVKLQILFSDTYKDP